jgi:hypothetical protein
LENYLVERFFVKLYSIHCMGNSLQGSSNAMGINGRKNQK